MTQRNRSVCWTTYADKVVIPPDPRVRYYIYQRETCPKTGKLHWQGFIQFYKAMRWPSIKKLFDDNTLHLENLKPNSTPQQAAKYCTPEYFDIKTNALKWGVIPGTQVEWGEITKPGERKDIEDIVEDMKNGVTSPAHDHYIYRYANGYRALEAKYCEAPARPELRLYYIWGEPNCGKTETAIAMAEGQPYYRMRDHNPLWLSKYRGQKVVIIDEFTGKIPISDMLQMLDPYPLDNLPTKGGDCIWRATKIIFCSNQAPDDCYTGCSNQSAWLSRFERRGEIIYRKRDPNYHVEPFPKGGLGGTPQ